MLLGRLGKNSTMIFCGDNQQIDLKDKNYSYTLKFLKLKIQNLFLKAVLEDNHRHEIDEVLTLLTGY